MKQLAALPLQGDRDLPGFYPIALDRVASDAACDLIRQWLDAADPRKELFRLSTTAPPADLDLAAAGDYFVTVEVLYCVWGGQCLVKPAIAQAVLQEALLEGPNLQDRNLVCVRAANFLVASLAMCTDTFFEAAGRIGMSTNPIVSSLAHDLDGLVSEGLGIATMARIESLRYSADPQEKVDLILTLTTVGNNLARMERQDAQQRGMALDYLAGLVEDVGVAEDARASALTAIARDGAWSSIERAATLGLKRDGPLLLSAIALSTLMANVRANPGHSSDALQLLQNFSDQGLPPQTQQAVDKYIAELTQ
jgi:hypothetical protein